MERIRTSFFVLLIVGFFSAAAATPGWKSRVRLWPDEMLELRQWMGGVFVIQPHISGIAKWCVAQTSSLVLTFAVQHPARTDLRSYKKRARIFPSWHFRLRDTEHNGPQVRSKVFDGSSEFFD